MDIDEGEGGTFGNGGNTDFNGSNPPTDPNPDDDKSGPPEQRRADKNGEISSGPANSSGYPSF
jgi:hypothetical protein